MNFWLRHRVYRQCRWWDNGSERNRPNQQCKKRDYLGSAEHFLVQEASWVSSDREHLVDAVDAVDRERLSPQ